MKNILFFLSFIPIALYSQVGVGTTTPNEFTILEAQSTSDGFLIPRISSADRNANLEDNNPTTPLPGDDYNHPCGGSNPPCEVLGDVTNNSTLPIGTLIFLTDDLAYEFWNGTTWTRIAGSTIGGGSASLPEILATDAQFNAATPITANWVLGDNNDGDLSGAVPYIGNATNNTINTALVLLGFQNEVDGSGEYGQDARSSDIKAADLFEWKESTSYATGLNTVFWPESEEATYDFQFTFDYDVNAGGSGKSLIISAWWGNEIRNTLPADYDGWTITNISMSPNQLVTEVAPNPGATFPPIGRPFLQFIKVIPSGNNESYKGFTITLRCLSSDRAFAEGFVFTLESDVDVSVTNTRVLVTRVR